MLQKIVAWFVGKKIITATGQMDAVSKTKLVAIVGVLMTAIPQIATAWGHPIVIPSWLIQILGYTGLWTLRDAIPPK